MVTVETIALAAFWSQPELLIFDADHNDRFSGKDNWIACEWKIKSPSRVWVKQVNEK